jgi:hypothetical protein
MKKAWEWCKKWGLAIAGVLLAILGAGWLWGRYKSKLGRAIDQATIADATAEVRALQKQREVLAERSDEHTEAIAELDEKLEENKKKIIRAYEGGKDLTDEELLKEMARLGI